MNSLASANSQLNIPQTPLVNIDTADYSDDYAEIIARLIDASEGRSLAESYRSDTLSDIKYGLGKLGTVIKIVSAVLTLFGAENTVDRWVHIKNIQGGPQF